MARMCGTGSRRLISHGYSAVKIIMSIAQIQAIKVANTGFGAIKSSSAWAKERDVGL
jgi:hypothetical protein